MADDEFVLLTTVPITPGREEEYLALVNEVNDRMRHEPTFVSTVLHRAADDPGLFMLYETWHDRADFFAVQMHRPYRATYEERLPGLLRAPRRMTVFEPLRVDRADPTPSADGDDAGPSAALRRFYAAEAAYMQAGGAARGADFGPIAATLDPDVRLHQSPDLPWGGEFRGHDGYAEWARLMSDAFDRLEVTDEQLFVSGDTIVSVCRFRTRSRVNGREIDAPMAQVVTVEDGLIVDFRPYYWNVPDYRAALEPRASGTTG